MHCETGRLQTASHKQPMSGSPSMTDGEDDMTGILNTPMLMGKMVRKGGRRWPVIKRTCQDRRAPVLGCSPHGFSLISTFANPPAQSGLSEIRMCLTLAVFVMCQVVAMCAHNIRPRPHCPRLTCRRRLPSTEFPGLDTRLLVRVQVTFDPFSAALRHYIRHCTWWKLVQMSSLNPT